MTTDLLIDILTRRLQRADAMRDAADHMLSAIPLDRLPLSPEEQALDDAVEAYTLECDDAARIEAKLDAILAALGRSGIVPPTPDGGEVEA